MSLYFSLYNVFWGGLGIGNEQIRYGTVYWESELSGGFIKDEYYSWVQYKSGPGGRPSM